MSDGYFYLADCRCVIHKDHWITYCGCCGPKRPPVYTMPRVEKRQRRDENVCTCKPADKTHTEGWRCVTGAQILECHHRLALDVSPDLDASKRFTWLWLHYSQDPVARRLSGRPITLAEVDRLHREIRL